MIIKAKDSAIRPQSSKSNSSSKSLAKTEPFYIGGKDNAKGSVLRQSQNHKPKNKAIPIVAISDKEENLTTKDVRILIVSTILYKSDKVHLFVKVA
jgi:hypothetical protein